MFGRSGKSQSELVLSLQNRVAELERAAARLFARRGYDRTNFEDVAAELDAKRAIDQGTRVAAAV